jgi:hypothetical protein
LFKNDDGIYFLDVSGKVTKNLTRVKARVLVTIADDDKYNCRSTFIDREVDCCRVNERTMSGPVLSTIYEAVAKKINFKLECPYKIGFYELKNAIFHLPRTPFKLWTGFYCMKVSFSARIGKSRKFEEVFVLEGKGSLEI